MSNAKVAVNGYGTVGKRIVDAISLQDDMELVGIGKTRLDFSAQLASKKGYKLFMSDPEQKNKSENLGIEIGGSIENMLEDADIVVDCTPDGIGEKNKQLYEKVGIKVIWQGGEEHDIAGFSFNASANYEEAIGRDYVRVVSCNTTGLTRTLCLLDKKFGVEKARATLIRRAADPGDIKSGPINAIIPDIEMPSHHGPDVQTILPHIKIATVAMKVPTTLMHVHAINVKLNKWCTTDDIICTFLRSSRMRLLDDKLGIKSTAQILELGRDLGRPRNDMWENNIWINSIAIHDGDVYLLQAIHQECIIVPENIDAIRAMMKIEKNGDMSIKKTNKSLGMSL